MITHRGLVLGGILEDPDSAAFSVTFNSTCKATVTASDDDSACAI